MITLINDNFINVIPTLDDESVSLFLIDIPYNISRDNNFGSMKDRKNRVGIDFGEWDKEFNELSLGVLIPKLKKGGSILIWSAFEQFDILRKVFQDLELKDKLIWEKSNPMPRNRDRRYVSNVELCTWYVKKGDKWTFNRQKESYESCVLKYPSESGGGFTRYHPTQKNLEMIKYLVNIHSNINDVVVDCFLGGGTTGVACKLLGRNFIGVELDKNYFEISKKRIENL
jgi:site-specific DNA-methyltransferase (adenine-specific)